MASSFKYSISDTLFLSAINAIISAVSDRKECQKIEYHQTFLTRLVLSNGVVINPMHAPMLSHLAISPDLCHSAPNTSGYNIGDNNHIKVYIGTAIKAKLNAVFTNIPLNSLFSPSRAQAL